MRDAVRPRDLWRSLEPRGQLALVGSGLLVLVTVFVLFQFAGKPSYTTISTGLSASQASKMGDALESAGIDYRFEGAGTQIAVKQGQESQARVAMGEAGGGAGDHVGFEIFEKSKLGATDFQQRVDYQRALEGEIARTVEQIDGVGAAQIQLVLPEESLFLGDESKASAAVLLSGAGGLDTAAVRGIAHLVASSVKGLSSDMVTITDETGQLLWPTGSAGSGATEKLAAEASYGAQLSAQVNGMLQSAVGLGKAVARVNATLDVDKKTIDQVDYAAKGTPLSAVVEQEALKSDGSTSAGPAGTASNVPTYAGGTTGTGTSNYKNSKKTTEFGVDKSVSQITVVPGTVKKLDISVMIDEAAVTDKDATQADQANADGAAPINQDLVDELEKSVKAAVGYDEQRGDIFNLSVVKFAKLPEAKAPASGPVAGIMANPLALLKPIGIGLAALVFLFLMRKSLKRREGDRTAPEPTWLREIERAIPVGELAAGEPQLDPEAQRRQVLQQQVEDVVRQSPDAVATQVTQWVRE